MGDQKQQPLSVQIKNIKRTFLKIASLPLADVLSTNWLKKIAESTLSRSDTIYTPLVVLRLFLLQALSDDRSCKAAVSRFLIERAREGETELSHNTGPYCNARARLDSSLVEEGVRESGRAHKVGIADKWYGYNVYITDGTTTILPDTEKNQEEFPQQRNQKPGLGFPIVRIGAIISLFTGAVTDYAIGPYEGKGTGEISLLNRMLGSLEKGDLLLADRYYATFVILQLLNLRGVHAVMKTHARRKIDYRKGTQLGERDHLIEWYKPEILPAWMPPEDFAALPDKLTVREFRVDGIDFVTTLVDHKQFHKQEISSLYRQRWNIEVDFRSIKTHMGMEMLSCLTPKMIKMEIAIYLLAYNIIRSIIAQAAAIHEKLPRKISFKSAAQLIVASATTIIELANQSLMDVTSTLLSAISTNSIGNREQTPQPRALKRRPRNYKLLMKPRELAVIDVEKHIVR